VPLANYGCQKRGEGLLRNPILTELEHGLGRLKTEVRPGYTPVFAFTISKHKAYEFAFHKRLDFEGDYFRFG